MRAHFQNGEEEFKYWFDLIRKKREKAQQVRRSTNTGAAMLDGYITALDELEKTGTYGIPKE